MTVAFSVILWCCMWLHSILGRGNNVKLNEQLHIVDHCAYVTFPVGDSNKSTSALLNKGQCCHILCRGVARILRLRRHRVIRARSEWRKILELINYSSVEYAGSWSACLCHQIERTSYAACVCARIDLGLRTHASLFRKARRQLPPLPQC